MEKKNVFAGVEITKEMLTNLRASVDNSYHGKDYSITIEKSKHMLDLIEQGTSDLKSFDRVYNTWFACHFLGTTYYDIEQYDNSLKYYEKALVAIFADDSIPTMVVHGHSTYWNMARAHNKLGQKEEAVKIYDDCIRFYDQQKLMYYKASCMVNKGEILEDIQILLEGIETYKDVDYKDELFVSVYEVLNGIDEAYRLMINIYLNNGDTLNATRYTKQIKNSELREKCLQLISQ